MRAVDRTDPPTRAGILDWLREVRDPELPAADVVGLGIVRDVELDGNGVTVGVTPTFSGCPAMREIDREIVACVERHGVTPVRVRTELAPAWSTGEIDEPTRDRLRAWGIAPPADGGVSDGARCPRCGVPGELRSRFGSTPCKSLWFCLECLEPFEAMKTM